MYSCQKERASHCLFEYTYLVTTFDKDTKDFEFVSWAKRFAPISFRFRFAPISKRMISFHSKLGI